MTLCLDQRSDSAVLRNEVPIMQTSPGRTLASLRKLKGWTQAQLAERLSLTQPIIARWENGRATPNETNLARLAKALGVTPESILAGQQDPYGPQPQSRSRSDVYQHDFCLRA